MKRPRPPYIMYTRERFDSGDLKHMPIVEATGRIAQEWKGLTEQEKKVRIWQTIGPLSTMLTFIRDRNMRDCTSKTHRDTSKNIALCMERILIW